MGLTAKVYREEIDNELGDLHGGQILLPLYCLGGQPQKDSSEAPGRDAPKSSGHQRSHSSSNLSHPNADQSPQPDVGQVKAVTYT